MSSDEQRDNEDWVTGPSSAGSNAMAAGDTPGVHLPDTAARVQPGTHALAITPTDSDILMGRGRGNFNHPGNCRFRLYVESCRGRYRSASSRNEQTLIIGDIVTEVKKWARFVQYDSETDQWYVVTDDTTPRRKVGQVSLLRSFLDRDLEPAVLV